MRAILVSVDYSDLLAVTLPYNRHHFESVTVVTSPADEPNVRPICERCEAEVVVTDLFYQRGAAFNKWAALEHGLDVMGRWGWLSIMDADVLWPRDASLELRPGKLLTPRRRMMTDLSLPIPPESEWSKFSLHPNEAEWAGYTQVFHASDPVLGKSPWHEIDWVHGGGADSFFQARWHPSNKIRPGFEVLHLGEAGANWCGRATPLLDGSLLAEAGERTARLRQFLRGRRGRPGDFSHEKLPG